MDCFAVEKANVEDETQIYFTLDGMHMFLSIDIFSFYLHAYFFRSG